MMGNNWAVDCVFWFIIFCVFNLVLSLVYEGLVSYVAMIGYELSQCILFNLSNQGCCSDGQHGCQERCGPGICPRQLLKADG